MTTHRKQDPFQKKVEAMEKGFANFPIPNVQLEFRREALAPAAVVTRLQAIVQTIEAVQETEAKHREAVKAYSKAMPKDHAFYEEAVQVVTRHFGSDPRLMAMFGLRPRRKSPGPSPEVVLIEEVVEVPERELQAEAEPEATDGGSCRERGEEPTRVEAPAQRPRRPRRPAHVGKGSRR